MNSKKVILVFDDLERSTLDEVAVLGCINEYCENKHIKTIIVANEEKILGKNIRQEVDEEQADDSEIRAIRELFFSMKRRYSHINY